MSNNACYYGQHIGCPYADDPNCRRCAERLTHAVNYIGLPALGSGDLAGVGLSRPALPTVEANCTPAEVAVPVGDESCRPTLWAMIAALIFRVLS
jgi:hypothetical protein